MIKKYKVYLLTFAAIAAWDVATKFGKPLPLEIVLPPSYTGHEDFAWLYQHYGTRTLVALLGLVHLIAVHEIAERLTGVRDEMLAISCMIIPLALGYPLGLLIDRWSVTPLDSWTYYIANRCGWYIWLTPAGVCAILFWSAFTYTIINWKQLWTTSK